MAITEDAQSREFRDTIAGLVVYQYYTCTWADWAAGTDGNIVLPRKGNTLEGFITRPDLMCAEVRGRAVESNNDYVRLAVTWSSEAFDSELARANQKSSWRESISVRSEELVSDAYLDRDEDLVKDWGAVWTAAHASYTEDNKPDLVQHKNRWQFNVTIYGNMQHIFRLGSKVGYINQYDFLRMYYQIRDSDIDHDMTATFADSQKWMFSDLSMQQVRGKTWQYDLQFTYKDIGWQAEQGDGTGSNVATNMYQLYDFEEIFKGMDRVDPADDISFR